MVLLRNKRSAAKELCQVCDVFLGRCQIKSSTDAHEKNTWYSLPSLSVCTVDMSGKLDEGPGLGFDSLRTSTYVRLKNKTVRE